jgi:hypothetical protein
MPASASPSGSRYAVDHVDHAVHGAGDRGIVTNRDHGPSTLVGKRQQIGNEPIRAAAVKARGGLVCQDDGGIGCQRAGDGDTLALAAGEGRDAAGSGLDPEALKECRRTRHDGRALAGRNVGGSYASVGVGGELFEE